MQKTNDDSSLDKWQKMGTQPLECQVLLQYYGKIIFLLPKLYLASDMPPKLRAGQAEVIPTTSNENNGSNVERDTHQRT